MSFRLALVQMRVSSNKLANLSRASEQVKLATENGAKVVSLPECFNSPYGTKYFAEYAEQIPQGESCSALSSMAKENGIYLIAGSIPELGQDKKLFNTCTIWSPDGKLLGMHRKMHLFDIDIPGKIRFKESEALTAGNEFTSFKTPWMNVGVGICYDIRFAEMAQIYARQHECKLLIYPGAFNMTTGPQHWEPLIRGRALDNQVYVAAVSPARDESAEYVAWGHSTIMCPFGDIKAKAGPHDEIIYADIDCKHLEEIRQQIPIGHQRRNDLYKVVKS